MSFRILEDEYTNLKGLCMAKGTRISDFARDALLRHCKEAGDNGAEPETVESRLAQLDVRLKLLDREMGRLLNRVAK